MSVTSITDRRTDDDDPAQDIPAEMSVLGALMLSREAITDVVEMVQSEHFYRPAHATLYECIVDMYLRDQPADAITVSGELEHRGELLRIGGAPYLHTLISAVPTAANATYYADLVLAAADRRRVGEVGAALSAYSATPGADAAEVLARAQDRITDAVDYRANSNTNGALLGSLIQPAVDELDAIAAGGNKGLPSGFADLDAVTNGFHPGQLITIAARTGVGKSALATDICRSVAIKQGVGVLLFSLEMGRTELVMRTLSAESRVRLADMRGGRMTDDDWTRVARRMGEIQESPLVIDDTSALTPVDMTARARKWARSLDGNLGVIVVD